MNFSNSLHRRDDFSIVSSSAKQSWSFPECLSNDCAGKKGKKVEGAVGNAENLSFSAGPANFREADQESAADNLNSTEDFRVERCEYYELSP